MIQNTKDVATYKTNQLHTVQLNLTLTEHMCDLGSIQHVFHFTSVQGCMRTQD